MKCSLCRDRGQSFLGDKNKWWDEVVYKTLLILTFFTKISKDLTHANTVLEFDLLFKIAYYYIYVPKCKELRGRKDGLHPYS